VLTLFLSGATASIIWAKNDFGLKNINILFPAHSGWPAAGIFCFPAFLFFPAQVQAEKKKPAVPADGLLIPREPPARDKGAEEPRLRCV
jgi:hypothetical protein